MQGRTLTKLFSNFGQKLLQHQTPPLAPAPLIRSRSIDPNIMFSTRPKFFQSLPRSASLVKHSTTAPYFSTSTKRVQLNSEAIPSKLINHGICPQIPTKFFTRRAEEETVEVEGIGWAGQPIVKRLHTILPEVDGDISDIFTAAKKSKAISEVDNNLQVQVRNFGGSHDIIAIINENAQNTMDETFTVNKPRRLHTKKDNIYCQYSGISIRNPVKLKKKKRTVVLASKPAILLSSVKSKKYKKKKSKSKKAIISKNRRIQPTMALNRRFSTMPLFRYDLFNVVNSHIKTFSALDYASKLSVTGQSKRGMASKSAPNPIIPADDCVCPEILYTTGKRKTTKICGEAEGASKAKKKSSWKQKMCLVEPREDPGRKKTFVCISEAAKQGKRKKELPKCPKPEKKVAPRVIVCEPKLEDEAEAKKKKKECVKIEEVKIRKRTQVCKPVVILAKEEVGIKVEKKAVCSTTRIKKVVSRHTKICPPSEQK